MVVGRGLEHAAGAVWNDIVRAAAGARAIAIAVHATLDR
jgi:hypothetical protein